MGEIVAISFFGWMMLATSSYKIRRELGIAAPATIAGLRVAAVVLLMLALCRCGAPVSGERWVRFLGGSAIAAVMLVLVLSVVPLRALRRDPK
ncbi:hypothetical protein U1701_11510 [Sphingomonas sp. PB2P19]|uniref:hypothetical protein n=1 Tax=Sphingomonas rhamnosi TaxID=3096156 RepID=UPI002FC921F9